MIAEQTSKWTDLATFLLFFISLAALLLFRTVYSTPIEADGDSVGKWFVADMIGHSGEWRALLENHHSLRWSIMLPQIMVSEILPGRYESYYVLPILFYSLFTFVVMLVLFESQQRTGLPLVVLLAVLVSVEPISHVMASQLKTVAFGLLYFSIGALLFMRYVYCRRPLWLVISALFFFFAYGAHITYLVFAVAPILVLIVNFREYWRALLFIGIFAIGFCFEYLMTSIVLGEADQAGRLAHIVSGGTHQPVTTARGSGAVLTYLDLISRWRLLPKFDLFVVVGYLVGAGCLIRKKVRVAMPIGIWLFFYASGVYLLAVSFPIVDVDPLRLAISLHNRYLSPIFPLAFVFLVWLFGYLTKPWEMLGKVMPLGISIMLALGFFSGSYSYSCTDELTKEAFAKKQEYIYCHFFRYSQNQNVYPAPDAFVFKAQNYYEQFVKDYLDGKVSLFGQTRLEIFENLIEFKKVNANYLKNSLSWYSMDGNVTEWCVMELGQTEKVNENYRYCLGKTHSRKIFD